MDDKQKALAEINSLIAVIEAAKGGGIVLEALIQARDSITKHIESESHYEWCTECKEYDREAHCCHRWSKQIHKTLSENREYWQGESAGHVLKVMKNLIMDKHPNEECVALYDDVKKVLLEECRINES